MSAMRDLGTNLALGAAMHAVRCFDARRFLSATRQPMAHQERLLQRILRENATTSFGCQHGFHRINSFDDWRSAVPVTTFLDLKPYIDRQRDTGEKCLTSAPPAFYARTSGTTGEPKYLPVSGTGLRRLSRIQKLVAQAQYFGSAMHRGRILAVVSPAIEGRFANGIAYGSATGLIYASMPRLVRSKYVVPAEIFGIADYDAKYYAIAALALREPEITGLAAANPTTFHKLIEVVHQHWGDLIDDIAVGRNRMAPAMSEDQKGAFTACFVPSPTRARSLARLPLGGQNVRIRDIWPSIRGIVTWTGGSCGFGLASLRAHWPPGAVVIEAGYVASEVWGTINIDAARTICVPNLTEVVFEFIRRADRDLERPAAFMTLDQLEAGEQYYVFVTTQDGLYRYDMNDIVEVDGYCNATPTIRFVQKGRGVTNITGEKLYETHVTQALARAQRDCDIAMPFAIALADEVACEYHLIVEEPWGQRPPAELFAENVDRHLAALNMEYREKRASGRLKPVRAQWVARGTGDLYRRECVASGQRDAQFKVQQLQYRRECAFDFSQHLSSR